MERRVREVLFDPLRKNVLSAIIPDLVFNSGDNEISAPAQLVRSDDEFRFTLHSRKNNASGLGYKMAGLPVWAQKYWVIAWWNR